MIKINAVTKYFSKNKVLDNIDISIKQGEIFGIVGHSGAGKSTLLRCFNGLESYDEGSIVIMDREVKNLGEKELREFRKDIGMIFQNFNLLSRNDVYHNVSLPLEVWGIPKKEIKERVNELLNLVGLHDKVNSKPKQLSGGQKQRVAIARALALNPKILLCDEATSALDPKTTKSILELLREINEKLGITIVIVTHQMEVVKEVCERVALLDGGVVVESGQVEKLFLSPSDKLKKLIGEEEDILPLQGINIRLIFSKGKTDKSIVTAMARELDIDFSIVWGRLEKFRNDVLGSLVININKDNKDKVLKYLKEKSIDWELIDNAI